MRSSRLEYWPALIVTTNPSHIGIVDANCTMHVALEPRPPRSPAVRSAEATGPIGPDELGSRHVFRRPRGGDGARCRRVRDAGRSGPRRLGVRAWTRGAGRA